MEPSEQVSPPVVPSGLARWVGFVLHGLTPMATSFRHFVARSLRHAATTPAVLSIIVRLEAWRRCHVSPEGTVCCSHGREPVDVRNDRKAPKGRHELLDEACLSL